jgi:hypothetical protein
VLAEPESGKVALQGTHRTLARRRRGDSEIVPLHRAQRHDVTRLLREGTMPLLLFRVLPPGDRERSKAANETLAESAPLAAMLG